jgi:hypothetical protein
LLIPKYLPTLRMSSFVIRLFAGWLVPNLAAWRSAPPPMYHTSWTSTNRWIEACESPKNNVLFEIIIETLTFEGPKLERALMLCRPSKSTPLRIGFPFLWLSFCSELWSTLNCRKGFHFVTLSSSFLSILKEI